MLPRIQRIGKFWVSDTIIYIHNKLTLFLAEKTEWSRSRERYKRWEEELVLLKRKMVMTICSFLKYQELWEWKASRLEIMPGMQAYTYG